MAQNNPSASAVAAKPLAKPVASAQARLILQDPLTFDQESQPALRSSAEMLAQPVDSLEREKARELWENLSLEPEVAQERQAERKRLLSRADQLARETAAAKAQSVALEAELSRARDERLNHPLVYAGAAGLLGLGAMWWLERRKRMLLQERELDAWAVAPSPQVQTSQPMASQPQLLPASKSSLAPQVADSYPELHDSSSVYSLEDSSDLAQDYAIDLQGLPEPPVLEVPIEEASFQTQVLPDKGMPEQAVKPSAPVSLPVPQAGLQLANQPDRQPDWAQAPSQPEKIKPQSSDADDLVAMSWQTEDRGLLAMSRRVLGNMLRRRSQSDALPSSHLPTEISASSHHNTVANSAFKNSEQHDDATQMLYDEEAQLAFEQELLEQQLSTDQAVRYDPDQANIDLLTQTRVTPQRGESEIEHLLELRTAISGLCALGRPEGAAKLLSEHIAADPATCAWAYLEYMHICEQLDQREEFESTRKHYRQQFNRMAPYWHEPNANVLGLDGYARAAGELCAVWAQGRSQALAALAAWLAGPLLGRKLVQLPAYHDLFDLYELLEFLDEQLDHVPASNTPAALVDRSSPSQHWMLQDAQLRPLGQKSEPDQDFVPTVSLLDLDYEFSSDVILEEREVAQSEKAVTAVKTGNFSVDFNVAGTQMGALSSAPADLAKK